MFLGKQGGQEVKSGVRMSAGFSAFCDTASNNFDLQHDYLQPGKEAKDGLFSFLGSALAGRRERLLSKELVNCILYKMEPFRFSITHYSHCIL